MFNSFTDNRYPDDYRLQNDDELDDNQEDSPHRNLESDIGKIKRAAFESCIFDIDVDDECTLTKGIWEQLQGIVRKQWFREAAIISAILIFKTGLFWAYRHALRNNVEIGNL